MSKLDAMGSPDNALLSQIRGAYVPDDGDEVSAAPPTFLDQQLWPLDPVRVIGLKNRRELISGAREVQRIRLARCAHLPHEMFGETSWEIMLALYVEDRQPLSLTAISMLVQAPMATLLRWITYLELKLLVVTVSISADTRVRLLQITDCGRDAMDEYMAEILRV